MSDLSKKKQSGSIWSALAAALPIACSVPLLSYLGIMIMTETGIWWFPLIIGYFVLITIPTTYWIERQKRDTYRLQIGPENFYRENPEALQRKLRKARKSGIPENVRRTAAYYRARPERVINFSDAKEKRRRVKAVLLYAGTVITALVGIYLILLAFPLPDDFLDQTFKKADYTPVFLLAGGVLALISAVGSFLRKKLRLVRIAAVIMLFLSIWSAYIAYTLRKRPTYTDCLIYAACLAVFLLSALAAPAIAGDIRTAEQIQHDRKELRIGLFEMGYIDEDELRLLLFPEL